MPAWLALASMDATAPPVPTATGSFAVLAGAWAAAAWPEAGTWPEAALTWAGTASKTAARAEMAETVVQRRIRTHHEPA